MTCLCLPFSPCLWLCVVPSLTIARQEKDKSIESQNSKILQSTNLDAQPPLTSPLVRYKWASFQQQRLTIFSHTTSPVSSLPNEIQDCGVWGYGWINIADFLPWGRAVCISPQNGDLKWLERCSPTIPGFLLLWSAGAAQAVTTTTGCDLGTKAGAWSVISTVCHHWYEIQQGSVPLSSHTGNISQSTDGLSGVPGWGWQEFEPQVNLECIQRGHSKMN